MTDGYYDRQVREQLRATEDELGQTRRRAGNLQRQLTRTEQALAAEEQGSIRELTAAVTAEHAARRYRLAWQSARRRAAAAEARLAELETDDGDWLTNVLYARKMSVIWGEPLVSPAFTGDKPQPAPAPEPVTLTARHLSYQRPACPGCEWAAHAPLTCDEVTAFRSRFDGLLAEGLREIQAEPLGFANTGTTTEIVAHQHPNCAGCGSPEVVYRNYLGTPLCCTCAACCEPQP